MLVLALDSATPQLSLALGEGRPGALRLLREADFPPEVSQSHLLPAQIEALLRAEGRSIGDLDAIVAGVGPGSFTGLRIGLATAKGVCYARRIPLVGLSSLRAMAWEAGPGDCLVPALDARKGEIYAGFFRRRGEALEEVEPEAALRPEALVEKLRRREGLRLFGLGEQAHRPALEAGLRYRRDAPATPRARALLALCPPLPAYDPAALAALEPHYVRPPEAEWTLKQKKRR